MMNAIGMIETKGLLAAVEGADVMLKAADVTLLDKSSATGGLITITVTGEVSAVQAAIEAATVSINRLNPNLLISKHVIARPSSFLESIISTSAIQAASATPIEKEDLAVKESAAVVEEVPAVAEDAVIIAAEEESVISEEKPVAVASPIEIVSPAVEVASVIEDEPTSKPTEDTVFEYSTSELQKMNLKHLREIANELPELNTKVDIKKATKQTLIKIIRDSQINKGRK